MQCCGEAGEQLLNIIRPTTFAMVTGCINATLIRPTNRSGS